MDRGVAVRFLFALFIIVPLLEIFVLIRVGKILGGLPTVALVLATAFAGVWLLKRQGRDTLQRAQAKLAQGVLPTGELADGLFLAFGGALLLTPGFITDAVGLMCLIPGVRNKLLGGLIRQWARQRGVQVVVAGQGANPRPAPGRTIEGEFERDDKN